MAAGRRPGTSSMASVATARIAAPVKTAGIRPSMKCCGADSVAVGA